jgi:signal transduction histidine kinase
LDDFACHFFDELLRALRRDSGVPDSYSSLPGKSEVAARLGAYQQRAGIEVGKVTAVFAAISQALAKTGALYELRLTAEEYDSLNGCLDAGIATSIESYWHRDGAQARERHAARYGFVAHELRNALSNASMAFKLVRAGKLDIEGRTGAILARNLARMNALIVHWLTSLQVDAGSTPTLEPVHLASVLRDVEASALPDRSIAMVLELDEMLFVEGDEMLLHSALSNLVHNAIKFSAPGSKVCLSARAVDGRAAIEVADQCGGIGERKLADLCRPYEKQQDGNPGGLGLGLAISKRAVESLGGEITLIDKPGDGCCFCLWFPLLQPRAGVRPQRVGAGDGELPLGLASTGPGAFEPWPIERPAMYGDLRTARD